MKKIISLLLAFILVFQGSLAFAEDSKVKDEDPLSIGVDQPLEETLTEEELEKIREAEIKAAFEREVEKHKDRSVEDLTTTYLIGDFKSGEILEGDNIDELVAIASTTKILTVYVALDLIKEGKYSLEDQVTIDRQTSFIGGSSYDLKEGEVVTIDELIKAAMIVSGNDAVNALAKHIAGSEEGYIGLMKKKLEELDIKEYNLINVSGLPNYVINEQNMLSTRSLFHLARSFLNDYPEMLEITKESKLIVPAREYEEVNTNPILGVVPQIDGLKTGYTGMAGRCMVATGIELGDGVNISDLRLIGITMGSNSDAERYVAIKKLMEHAFSTYERVKVGETKVPMEIVHNEDLEPEDINIYPREEAEILKVKGQIIDRKIDLGEIKGPLKIGEKVGSVIYTIDGDIVHETDLIVKDEVIESSIIKKLQIMYRNMYVSTYKLFND